MSGAECTEVEQAEVTAVVTGTTVNDLLLLLTYRTGIIPGTQKTTEIRAAETCGQGAWYCNNKIQTVHDSSHDFVSLTHY